MHSNTIMNQWLTLVPRHQFDNVVSEYSGNRLTEKKLPKIQNMQPQLCFLF